MLYPHKNNSPLPLYFLASLGVHLIILASFILVLPSLKTPKYNRIMISFSSPISTNIDKKPVLQTSPPIIKKNNTQPIKKTQKVKKIQKSITKPIKKTQKKVVQKNKSLAIPKPQLAPHSFPIKTNIPAPQTITEPPTPSQSEILADKLDDILDQNTSHVPEIDFLVNASWSGTPRKTIAFPNLSAQIPSDYQSRGYGFSVTAKIIFSPQGWVSSVELIQSSGDPRIDRIFRNELRKIRIEESTNPNYDTIIKTFTISVK